MGKTALGQSAEVLRKIRNSARFILGNIGDAPSRKKIDPVPWKLLGPVGGVASVRNRGSNAFDRSSVTS